MHHYERRLWNPLHQLRGQLRVQLQRGLRSDARPQDLLRYSHNSASQDRTPPDTYSSSYFMYIYVNVCDGNPVCMNINKPLSLLLFCRMLHFFYTLLIQQHSDEVTLCTIVGKKKKAFRQPQNFTQCKVLPWHIFRKNLFLQLLQSDTNANYFFFIFIGNRKERKYQNLIHLLDLGVWHCLAEASSFWRCTCTKPECLLEVEGVQKLLSTTEMYPSFFCAYLNIVNIPTVHRCTRYAHNIVWLHVFCRLCQTSTSARKLPTSATEASAPTSPGSTAACATTASWPPSTWGRVSVSSKRHPFTCP